MNQWIGPSQKREGKGTTERKHGVVDVAIFDTRKIRTGHPTEGSVAIGLRTKLLRVDLRRVIRADRDNIELRLIDIREIDLMRLGVGGAGVEIHGAYRHHELPRNRKSVD